jgi:hypothetical protein
VTSSFEKTGRAATELADGGPATQGDAGSRRARAALSCASEGGCEHRDTPGEQGHAGRAGKPVARGNSLFEQDEQRETGVPVEVHDAANKKQPHQEPATADTERAMNKTHAQRAKRAALPMLAKKFKRRSALAKAGSLQGGELVEAGGKQHDAAEDRMGADEHWREEAGQLEAELKAHRDPAEASPGDEIAEREQACREVRTGGFAPPAIDRREQQTHHMKNIRAA